MRVLFPLRVLALLLVALSSACALLGGVDDDYRLRPSSTSSSVGGTSSAGGSGGTGAASGGSGGGSGGGCAVGASGPRTCLRKTNGTVWCWGYNFHGQVGDGTTDTPKLEPVEVVALGAEVASLSVGDYHTCATKNDATLWCWGSNADGRVGDGTTDSPKSSPVSITSLGATIDDVSAGVSHTCARKTDGTLWCWGANLWGAVGDGTNDSPKPSPGEVSGIGTAAARVSAGEHTCARKTDGTLWCWGPNGDGQLGDGSTSTYEASPVEVTALGAAVAEVSVGTHSCARKTDETLWCWGRNDLGQLGDGSTSMYEASPIEVTALGAAVARVSTGTWHTCAIKTDGTLWCWGRNDLGQVGDGSNSEYEASPVEVTALGATVRDVSVGGAHTCALKSDGTLWCWGANEEGQLGEGSTDSPKPSPTLAAITCE